MRNNASAAGCLEFLEAAYAWELEDEAWFRGVLRAAVKVWGRPRWAFVTTYDASDPCRGSLERPMFWKTPVALQNLLVGRLMARASDPEVVHLNRTVSLGFAKPIGGINELDQEALSAAKTLDMFVLNGLDGTGRGCFIGIGADRTVLTPEEILVFQRLTAHLGSAYRCRRRLRGQSVDAVESSEAILRPDGRVLDARGPAESATARTALTDAVRAMERVRRRREVEVAAEDWRPRIKTRWTLVDSPEGDRDRYVLARENQVESRGLELLTERERQVVACVAAGRSTKELAYELGISHATARVLLGRAYGRLGVKSREELFGLKSIRGLRGEPPADLLK